MKDKIIENLTEAAALYNVTPKQLAVRQLRERIEGEIDDLRRQIEDREKQLILLKFILDS
jgi:hypothetical protein